MTLLNEADAIYLGGAQVDAVYAGATKVWPAGAPPPEEVLAYHLLTSYSAGFDRDGLPGGLGMLVTQDTPTVFNRIGAYCGKGTLGPKRLRLFNNDSGETLATATVDLTNATPGQWYWVSIPDTTLVSGITYCVWAEAASDDGYIWPSNSSCTVSNGDCWAAWGEPFDTGTGEPYGEGEQFWGVDLGYVAPATTTSYNLVTSLTPNPTPQNDWTGAVGLMFMLTQPMTFNKIGAAWWGGATGAQKVALLNADAYTVLAQATVTLGGGTVGDFFWADIPETALAAGVNYILWRETTNGDGFMWLDQSPCTVANGDPTNGWWSTYGYSVTDVSTWAKSIKGDQWGGVDLAYEGTR